MTSLEVERAYRFMVAVTGLVAIQVARAQDTTDVLVTSISKAKPAMPRGMGEI